MWTARGGLSIKYISDESMRQKSESKALKYQMFDIITVLYTTYDKCDQILPFNWEQ